MDDEPGFVPFPASPGNRGRSTFAMSPGAHGDSPDAGGGLTVADDRSATAFRGMIVASPAHVSALPSIARSSKRHAASGARRAMRLSSTRHSQRCWPTTAQPQSMPSTPPTTSIPWQSRTSGATWRRSVAQPPLRERATRPRRALVVRAGGDRTPARRRPLAGRCDSSAATRAGRALHDHDSRPCERGGAGAERGSGARALRGQPRLRGERVGRHLGHAVGPIGRQPDA